MRSEFWRMPESQMLLHFGHSVSDFLCGTTHSGTPKAYAAVTQSVHVDPCPTELSHQICEPMRGILSGAVPCHEARRAPKSVCRARLPEGRLPSTKAKSNNYVRRARRKWTGAIWIIGDGPYASVSRCPPGDTVMLFGTKAEAETLKSFIDSTGCCEGCRRDHLVVQLKINRRT